MASAHEFTHAGATLVVEQHGSGAPMFVLIHGIGMGRHVYSDLIAHLDDQSAVLSVDLPGYGDAPEPPRTLTIERTADLVAACLLAHDARGAVVVGHSMGAQIALEIAARHPGLVDGLVLVGPTVDPRARTAPRQIWRLLCDLAVESPRVIAVGAREYLRAGPNLRAKFHAMIVHRPEDSLARIVAPALVLRGENDVVAPRAWCDQVVEGISDARLVEIPGHGHETMIRDAAPAAALIATFARGVGA